MIIPHQNTIHAILITLFQCNIHDYRIYRQKLTFISPMILYVKNESFLLKLAQAINLRLIDYFILMLKTIIPTIIFKFLIQATFLFIHYLLD